MSDRTAEVSKAAAGGEGRSSPPPSSPDVPPAAASRSPHQPFVVPPRGPVAANYLPAALLAFIRERRVWRGSAASLRLELLAGNHLPAEAVGATWAVHNDRFETKLDGVLDLQSEAAALWRGRDGLWRAVLLEPALPPIALDEDLVIGGRTAAEWRQRIGSDGAALDRVTTAALTCLYREALTNACAYCRLVEADPSNEMTRWSTEAGSPADWAHAICRRAAFGAYRAQREAVIAWLTAPVDAEPAAA